MFHNKETLENWHLALLAYLSIMIERKGKQLDWLIFGKCADSQFIRNTYVKLMQTKMRFHNYYNLHKGSHVQFQLKLCWRSKS